jgi:hypothetical protein
MTDATNLTELIASVATGDPDETAEAVFAAVNCPSKWRDLFYGVVRDECRRRYRLAAIQIEISGTDQTRHDTQTGTVGARISFLESRFYDGDKYVTQGAALIPDHERRIAFQGVLRGGIDADIGRHRWAIDKIKAAGVSCLNEITDLDIEEQS